MGKMPMPLWEYTRPWAGRPCYVKTPVLRQSHHRLLAAQRSAVAGAQGAGLQRRHRQLAAALPLRLVYVAVQDGEALDVVGEELGDHRDDVEPVEVSRTALQVRRELAFAVVGVDRDQPGAR